MLALSRREGENLIIGDGPNRIVVTVASVEDGRVKIGVTAPKDVPVMRAELVDAKRPEGK